MIFISVFDQKFDNISEFKLAANKRVSVSEASPSIIKNYSARIRLWALVV
jgi:hypothetical protein